MTDFACEVKAPRTPFREKQLCRCSADVRSIRAKQPMHSNQPGTRRQGTLPGNQELLVSRNRLHRQKADWESR